MLAWIGYLREFEQVRGTLLFRLVCENTSPIVSRTLATPETNRKRFSRYPRDEFLRPILPPSGSEHLGSNADRLHIAVLWKFFAVESTSNALNNIPQASELFYKIALPMEGHVIIDDLFILSDPFNKRCKIKKRSFFLNFRSHHSYPGLVR
uniref:Uncharacterized protein n=1 Tax=Vespula pensylvanica TaxID=30213 RepID=A0A834KEX2_VESPE|nr:hypothetical protein H0235_014345 [Vespula pensylvanica]